MMYAEHRVDSAFQAVTATSAVQNGIKLVPDERHVSDAANEVAVSGTGLAGGQSIGDRGPVAVPVKLGNARGKPAAVGTYRPGNLRAFLRCGGGGLPRRLRRCRDHRRDQR